MWVHKSQKRHVDGETSECIYISGLYWITSYPWQTLVVVSQTPGSLIYTFTFLFLSAKDYLRLNGLAIHNLSYCGPSFPDTVSLFFRGDGLVGATLFCTSRPSWLSMRDFPWFGHQHHIHAGRERDQLPGWRWLAGCKHLCSSTRDAKLFSFAGFCPSVLLVSLSLGGDVLLSAGDGHLFSFRDELPKAPSDRTVSMRMRGIPQTWQVATFQGEPGAKLYAPGRSYKSRAKRIAESGEKTKQTKQRPSFG